MKKLNCKKTAGYVLAALALAGIAASFPLRSILESTLPSDIARILGLAALLGFVALKVCSGMQNK